jgi:hypothetical protein
LPDLIRHSSLKTMDARVEPGHDEKEIRAKC